jgi:hypothetical protein
VGADRQALERRVANSKDYMLLSICISAIDTITFNAIKMQLHKNFHQVMPSHCVFLDDNQIPILWFSKLDLKDSSKARSYFTYFR